MTGRRRSERGSMTVIMLVLIAGGLALAVLTSGVIRAQAARGHAQAAADLAALAAAEVAATGGSDPCGTAQVVAQRNRAELQQCQVGSGAMVTVTVAVPAQLLPGWSDTALVRSRAGPVGHGRAGPYPAGRGGTGTG